MAGLHVLVIDDEPALRQILAGIVTRAGYSVDKAASVSEAAAKLASGDVDVALCDINLPDGNGIDLVRNSRASGMETEFIMVTAFASLETAVEALRAGASDYVIKPVHNDEILHRLAQVEAMRVLREENTTLRRAARESAPKLYRFSSPEMLDVERLVSKVAPTDSTVLISGESGTGKGVVARLVHEQSARREMPFLQVNCSAIPEHLMESEFFGHVKGAFTGADRARKGIFLQADKGTLFLDEIGELPLHLQTKLLNVIEDKEVRPVGSDHVRRVDTRIIAATNRDLKQRVAEGIFREDLYFRISMFHIPLPPLRQRSSDMRGLIKFLLEESKMARDGSAQPMDIDPIAEEILLSYDWPGNVRELENVINRARILAEDNCLCAEDLPQDLIRKRSSAKTGAGSDGAQGFLRDQLRSVEADIIGRAISQAGGDRRLAAQNLGIGLSSLYRKLEESERGDPAP